MAVTKEILSQYISEKKEIEELREKIGLIRQKMKNLAAEIPEIENISFQELDDVKTELELKKKMICNMELLLITSETHLLLREKQTEQFISSINDSLTRRILRFRVIDGLKWKEVAQKIGGNNTEDGVRAIYNRFMVR